MAAADQKYLALYVFRVEHVVVLMFGAVYENHP